MLGDLNLAKIGHHRYLKGQLDGQTPSGNYVGLLARRWSQRNQKGDQFAIFLPGDKTVEALDQAARGKFNREHSSGEGGLLEVGKWHRIAPSYWFDKENQLTHILLYQDYKLVSRKDFRVGAVLSNCRNPSQMEWEGKAITRPFRYVKATFDEVWVTGGLLSPL